MLGSPALVMSAAVDRPEVGECRGSSGLSTVGTGHGTSCRLIRPIGTHNEQLMGMLCPCVINKNGVRFE